MRDVHMHITQKMRGATMRIGDGRPVGVDGEFTPGRFFLDTGRSLPSLSEISPVSFCQNLWYNERKELTGSCG